MKLKSFIPFKSAEDALQNCNDVSEGTHGTLYPARLPRQDVRGCIASHTAHFLFCGSGPIQPMRNGAGLLSETLRDFLEMNLPKAKKEKKPKFSLGVQDSKLGNSISETMQVPLPQHCPPASRHGAASADDAMSSEHSTCSTAQVSCKCNEMTNELLRGVRAHFSRMVKGLKDGDIEKAQLGLAHSYSRSKVPLSGY